MRASVGFTTWPTDYLAQLNLGLFRAPLDAPQMAEFTAALGPIKAIAESTPGFVWRLQDENGESSSYVGVPGRTDPLWAPNMSVWEDFDSLKHFMYKSGHAQLSASPCRVVPKARPAHQRAVVDSGRPHSNARRRCP